MKSYLIIVALVLSAIISVGQNPAMKWYFGDKAGIDFSAGAPVPVTNGAMQTYEGCAAISNETGGLMFYTNGGSLPYAGGIWNRNHQLMPNGLLNNTGGCNSSFQSSIILPHPDIWNYPNLYYLFTTDCIENNCAGGLRYSIIDMNLDGGLGDVVVKSNLLVTPVNESLAAIAHPGGKGYWIIAHKMATDTFYAYWLSYYGIEKVVKTRIGNVPSNYAGAITASSNGQKIAFSSLTSTSVYDFDIFTGELSNHKEFNLPSFSNTFSPDCQLLYVANAHNKQIYQLDLTVADPVANKVLVGTTASSGVGSLQLGPDGRIYVARFFGSSYLGIIRRPNLKGVNCSYIDDGFHLGGKKSNVGLPSFVNSFVGECADYIVDGPGPKVENTSGYPLQLGAYSSEDASFNWSSVKGASGYVVKEKNLNTGETKTYTTRASDYTAEGLTSNTNYQFAVFPLFDNEPNVEYLQNYLVNDLMESNAYKTLNHTSVASVRTLSGLEMSVYPNPAKTATRVAIKFEGDANELTVKISDAKGRILNEVREYNLTGNYEMDMPLDELANGVYQVTVISGEKSTVEKLVVLK